MVEGPCFLGSQEEGSKETDDEDNGTQETKYVHRLLAEGTEEPQGHQVEIAVHETVPTHELRLTILAFLVVYGLLSNLVETGILGKVGDETVHLTEHLNVLDDLTAIGLQSAVEVMQVIDTADLAGGGIEELGR